MIKKQCPYCGSYRVDYRVRSHDYRCIRCHGITSKGGIVIVSKERAFSKHGASSVSSFTCHRNRERGVFNPETTVEEAIAAAGLV
jgi:hypothetical protein